ncbi:MAG: hypothetical protein QM498_16110 [Desulfobacterium sp.]
MTIIFNLKKSIMTASIMAVLSLLFLGAVLAADSLSLIPRSNFEASFQAYSNQFQSKMPLANKADYTLLESLWTKVVDENRFLHWNNGELFEEGAYFQPGVLEYELYKGKFKDISYIREKMAERYVLKMAEKMLMETPIAKKVDKFGKEISRHLRMQYIKPGQDEKPLLYLPGQDLESQPDDQEKLYEIIFSAHLYDQLPGTTFGCSMEVNSSYYGISTNMEFIPGHGELGMEVTSHWLNTFMGGRTSLEFVTSEGEVSSMVKISFGL